MINMEFIIRTKKKGYRLFNGLKCKVVCANRDDGLVEVFIPKYECMILLRPDELEDY